MPRFHRKPEFQVTDRAVMRAGEAARQEALLRRSRTVDPRYLLLGLLDSDDPLLGEVFRAAEVDVPQARARVEAALPAVVGPLDARLADRTLAYTGDATRAWELSGEEARELDDAPGPGPVHLLIALLRQNGEAAALLREAGLSAEGVRAHLAHLRQASAT